MLKFTGFFTILFLYAYHYTAAQNPSLVDDINRQPLLPAPDYYGSLNAAGGKLFFDATDNRGFGLWNSAGTQSGAQFSTTHTALLVTQSPSAIQFKNELYFTGSDFGLWKSDGSDTGTSEVSATQLNIYVQGPVNNFFTISNNLLFYNAGTDETGAELWKSDGTTAGTSLVKDINPGSAGSSPFFITAFQNKILFAATSINTGTELFISDGTENGTQLLKDINPGSASSAPSYLVAYNGEIYFLANDGVHGGSLWKTDGTTAGTVLVKDFDAGSTADFGENMCPLNGKLLLYVNTVAKGEEPWISDGTSEGTYLLADVNPGKKSSNFGYPVPPFFVSGNEAYFTALVALNNEQIWKTDGTISGTQEITNLSAETFGALPDGKIIFTTYYYGQSQLWVTDGTSAGTDSIPIHFFSRQELLDFVPFNGKVFFIARDANGTLTNTKLCYTDGTLAGTQQLQIETGETSSSSPSNMIRLSAGNYVFTANDSIHGNELWQTNGTTSATLLKDIISGASSSNIQFCPKSENGMAYFGSADSIIGTYYSDYKLWKTDGTQEGTVAVQTCQPVFDANHGFAFLNDILYFVNNNHDSYELWRSDGTKAGTFRIKKINSVSNETVAYLAEAAGVVYFAANDGAHGQELWKTDGTEAGTVLVKDIEPGFGSSYPAFLTAFNNKIFFEADDGTDGYELWISDGTADGTYLLKDIYPGDAGSNPGNFTVSGSELYFSATSDATGNELYKTDGTTLGTLLVKDIADGIYSSSPVDLTDVNGTLYFRTWTPSGKSQNLEKTDGSKVGTVKIMNFNFDGLGNTSIGNFMNVNGYLYFAVNDPATGDLAVWRTDGSECRTQKLDLFPGSDDEASILLADSNLIFLGLNSEAYGAELYKYVSTPIPTIEICNGIDDDCNGIIDDNSVAEIFPDSGLEACNGIAVTLTANDGLQLTYQWRKNGNDIAGGTNITYTFTHQGGSYDVVVSHSGTCNAASDAINIDRIKNPEALITAPNGLDLCNSRQVKLVADSGTGFTYQWYIKNKPITAVTGQIYNAKVAGDYKVEVSNSSGCSKLSKKVTVFSSCRKIDSMAIAVYPNPASDILSVQISDEMQTPAMLIVYDMTGRKILSWPISSAENTINVSSLTEGVYLIRIESLNQAIQKLFEVHK